MDTSSRTPAARPLARRALAAILTAMLAAVVGGAITGCGSDSGGSSGPRTFPQEASVTAGTTPVFTPGSVDIAAGGTVTWSFSALAHTVTFQTANSPADVPATTNNQVPRPFPTPGTYHYICTIHPGMSGTVVVH